MHFCLHISDGPARSQEGQEVGGRWSVGGEATRHVAEGRDSSLHGSAPPPGGQVSLAKWSRLSGHNSVSGLCIHFWIQKLWGIETLKQYY